MQHTGFGSVRQLVVWGREVRGAGWFRAVCTAGTEGLSTSAASTLKPGRPLNKANGIFCGDPPGLPLGVLQGERQGAAGRPQRADRATLRTAGTAGGPVWTEAQNELPARTGLPAPDRVHEWFHGVPGRNGVRRTFQHACLAPPGRELRVGSGDWELDGTGRRTSWGRRAGRGGTGGCLDTGEAGGGAWEPSLKGVMK